MTDLRLIGDDIWFDGYKVGALTNDIPSSIRILVNELFAKVDDLYPIVVRDFGTGLPHIHFDNK